MKKQFLNKQWAVIAMAILFTALSSGEAFAVPPTASGLTISNTAKVNYKVSTVLQDEISSSAYEFKVDTKIDLTVTADSTEVSVTPGTTAQVMKFKVANTGNKKQAFKLTPAYVSGTFTVTTFNVFSESTPGTSTYTAGTDDNTEIYRLDFNTELYVYIVADIPSTATDGQTALMSLVATTYETAAAEDTLGVLTTDNSGAADDPDVVQVVFGDGNSDDDIAKDGKHAARQTYKIQSAKIEITKTSSVISDGFSAVGEYKRIPGAIIEYVITATNNGGSATATNVEVSDDLTNEVITQKRLEFVSKYSTDDTRGVSISMSWFNTGTYYEFTNADDVEAPIYDGVQVFWEQSGTVAKLWVKELTLKNGDTAIIKFKMRIL